MFPSAILKSKFGVAHSLFCSFCCSESVPVERNSSCYFVVSGANTTITVIVTIVGCFGHP